MSLDEFIALGVGFILGYLGSMLIDLIWNDES
jgi:hypothetical protein